MSEVTVGLDIGTSSVKAIAADGDGNVAGSAPVLDTTTAATASPLFDWKGWDASIAGDVGVRVDQLPKLAPTGSACGRVGGPDGPELAPGCIDAFAEQLVAGADDDGDVLVILGTTLIVWAVTSREDPVPDHYVIRTPRRARCSSA